MRFQTTIIDMLTDRVNGAIELLRALPCGASAPRVDALVAQFMESKQSIMNREFDKYAIPASDRSVAHFIAIRLEDGTQRWTCAECTRLNLPTEIGSTMNHFKSTYAGMIYQIADFLRDPQCELIKAILERRIQAGHVANIGPDKLCPSVLQKEREEIELRRKQRVEEKTSKAYKCKKCGKNETTMQEMQTRSSDEAPTLVVQCVNCGYRWSQSS